MGKVALVFVFNHRYDKNIAVLEAMYKNRFSNIFHLVPFYDGDKENVIPVYENSYHFQGYMAQGFREYFRQEFEHYLFVADDLVINPAISENNYKEHFQLGDDTCFIPEIFSLHHFTNTHTLRFIPLKSALNTEEKLYWWRVKDIVKYRHINEGVENEKEMPSRKEATERLQKHGYAVKPLSFHDIYGYLPVSLGSKEKRQQTLRYLYRLNRYSKSFSLDYPLVASYSDIVIVSRNAIKKFCHYCGVFASNHLFVECAIPTALLLASENVITEKDIDKRGSIYWNYTNSETAAYEKEMEKYEYTLNRLIQHFPEDKLYIHPVKLSKWKTQLQ